MVYLRILALLIGLYALYYFVYVKEPNLDKVLQPDVNLNQIRDDVDDLISANYKASMSERFAAEQFAQATTLWLKTDLTSTSAVKKSALIRERAIKCVIQVNANKGMYDLTNQFEMLESALLYDHKLKRKYRAVLAEANRVRPSLETAAEISRVEKPANLTERFKSILFEAPKKNAYAAIYKVKERENNCDRLATRSATGKWNIVRSTIVID